MCDIAKPQPSLDPAGRRDFLRELVERTIERQTTVVFSTHILSDLERVALNVAFMRQGKIVLQQSLDSLTEQTHRLIGPAAIMKQHTFPGELTHSESAAGLSNMLVRFDEQEWDKIDTLRAQGVSVEPVGLEDLFIEVTQ